MDQLPIPSTEAARKIVVVLGMHRSGTSAITRGLPELGVDLGDTFIPTIVSQNAKGFWEDIDLNHLDDELLNAMGFRWDSVAAITPSAFKGQEVDAFRMRAIDLLVKKLADKPVWGFKDPRVVRLLPFWKPIFESLGVLDNYIIVVRNPLSVAKSLEVRDGFSFAKSCLLWLEHTLSAVSQTVGSPCVVVDYDLLLDNPIRELERIATTLKLDMPANEQLANSEYLRHFLTTELRHFSLPSGVLRTHPVYAGLAREVYELMVQVTQDRLSIEELRSKEPWKRVEDLLENFAPFLLYLDNREKCLEELQNEKKFQAEEFCTLRSQIVEIEQQLRTKDTELRQHQAQALELTNQLTAATQQLHTKDTELQRRQAQALELTNQLTAATQQLCTKDTELQQIEQLLLKEEQRAASRIEDLEGQLATASNQISDLLHSTSWRITTPMRFFKYRMLTLKEIIREWVYVVYLVLPFSMEAKLKIKSVIFATLSPLLRNTTMYRAWLVHENSKFKPESVATVTAGPSLSEGSIERQAELACEDSRPESVATVTAGPSLSEGGIERQADHLLARHLTNRSDPQLLMIDSIYPKPDRDSGSIDAANYIQIFLDLGYQVTFMACNEFGVNGNYRRVLEEKGVRCPALPEYESVDQFIAAEGATFNLVFLSRIHCGGLFYEMIRRYSPDAKIIFNTVDLHYLREEREARIRDDRIALSSAQSTKERELYIARQADVTLVVSDNEKEIIEREVPGAIVSMIPLMRDCPGPVKNFKNREGIGFIGSFLHQPNVDAVNYFLECIWPFVLEKIPTCHFYIIGADMPDEIAEYIDNNVVPIGYVNKITPWLEHVRLSVAPLRYGAGAKGKVASSLAHGVPCVASPVAVEGMGLQDGLNVTVAHTVQDFVDRIALLYENESEWLRLSQESYLFASSIFSLTAGKQYVKNVLDTLNLPGGNQPM